MAGPFKGAHFPQHIILTGVRWSVAYPLSTRHVEELMRECGIHVEHSTLNRGVITYSQQLEEAFHRHKRPVWRRCGGGTKRTFASQGSGAISLAPWRRPGSRLIAGSRNPVTSQRPCASSKAIQRHSISETITVAGSEANAAAIRRYNADHGTVISIRQMKYLYNIIEQDHRGVKRVTHPMLGCKLFAAAQATLVGIALMHMLKKRQLVIEEGAESLTPADQFYALAA